MPSLITEQMKAVWSVADRIHRKADGSTDRGRMDSGTGGRAAPGADLQTEGVCAAQTTRLPLRGDVRRSLATL